MRSCLTEHNKVFSSFREKQTVVTKDHQDDSGVLDPSGGAVYRRVPILMNSSLCRSEMRFRIMFRSAGAKKYVADADL